MRQHNLSSGRICRAWYHGVVLGVLVCVVLSWLDSGVDGFSAVSPPPRRVLVTFDLDDTLFPVVPVVQDANAAMFETLTVFGYPTATQEGYMEACRELRRESSSSSDATATTYSELRRRALRKEMQRCSSGMDGDFLYFDDVAEAAFDAWLDERHESAERRLFPEALPMLDRLRASYADTDQQQQRLVVGAITNGRGNPAAMTKTLRPYFEFCVSGEDDDVFPQRKPHPGIYEVALERARRIMFGGSSGDRESDDDAQQRPPPPLSFCWIHVGDDLANDVGASADCGAYAVWMDTDAYFRNHRQSEEEATTMGSQSGLVTTASPEEQETRRRLAEEAGSKVTTRIETLADLPDVIDKILNSESLSSSVTNIDLDVFEKSTL